MTMALLPNKLKGKPLIPSKSADLLKEKLKQLIGVALFVLGGSLIAILVSYDPIDPSFRSATGTSANNIFGSFGSYIADPLHLAIGISAYGIAFLCFVWGWRFVFKISNQNFIQRIIFTPVTIAFLSMFLAAHPAPGAWNFNYGIGGVFGDNAFSLVLGIALFEVNNWLKITTVTLAILTFALSSHTLGLTSNECRKIIRFFFLSIWSTLQYVVKGKHSNSNSFDPNTTTIIGNKNFNLNSTEERIKTKINEVIVTRNNQDDKNETIKTTEDSQVPSLGGVTKANHFPQQNRSPEATEKRTSIFERVQKTEIRKPLKSSIALREEQPTLQFEPSQQKYNTPALSLLENPTLVSYRHLSDDALNENARMLENVLDDYGVKGEVVSVRPGPVVTLYELEPAAGLKASRVIGLSDDIARSMSALSARVSTIPGRSVIGIELPNADREKVLLREILSSRAYGDSKFQLPLALGKDIGGETIVTNLARMPHLLIAGTTGSGKSVGINTMILSLLYSLTPDQCRLIMIDPKMLELSVYDGIPHLLSPVVTDPKKAVVALKWAVSEMEERYRKMSKMGVRNIDGFNARVDDAITKGENFDRTVQTGFDQETGDPIYETEHFIPEKIPYIVVIVDEMADLMMVAGKEIEACIQRLAQMARAAGIHLIMATQRPSVDVITGTIKANFPSRISFQVTSKIDSRTILGEMGAEQLLGMGDMLYMASNGRITRIHGPFVSDEEVEEIVTFLKSQGSPVYVSGVINGPDSETELKLDQTLGLASNDDDSENALYDQAVAIVAHDRKCSTSYIQRKLSIGYNRAAKIVEAMEEQGIVSQSNHVGKREILIPEI
ncbi:MAG: DNA translocase FtsK 4TM domain-containing protein [Paracoccaceae bacterium]|nr:DNA translocase FtsK 4TM domain-containing protein [Paracoccaceae bacterium]